LIDTSDSGGASHDETGEVPEGPPPAAAQDLREVVVPEALDGARLDKALAQLVPELSRARVKRAIELGACA